MDPARRVVRHNRRAARGLKETLARWFQDHVAYLGTATLFGRRKCQCEKTSLADPDWGRVHTYSMYRPLSAPGFLISSPEQGPFHKPPSWRLISPGHIPTGELLASAFSRRWMSRKKGRRGRPPMSFSFFPFLSPTKKAPELSPLVSRSASHGTGGR